MSFPHFDLVEQAYQELVNEGWIKELPPGNQQAVEDQKGVLTRRAALYTNARDAEYGILEKKTGNNSEGYSTDIIINKDGNFYDVASDNGTIAFPIQGGDHFDLGLVPRWRQPTRALAKLDEVPEPIPEPEPNPEPPDEVKKLLIELFNMQLETKAQVDLLVARQDTTDAHLNDARRMLREIQNSANPDYLTNILGRTVTSSARK